METKSNHVYLVGFNGNHFPKVTSSVEEAYEYIGHNFDIKNQTSIAMMYPGLVQHGVLACFKHRVRRYCEVERAHVDLVTHDLSTLSSQSSAVERIGVTDIFDPSYLLQMAIYEADDTDKNLYEMAEELANNIDQQAIDSRLLGETDDIYLERIRKSVNIVGNPEILSEIFDDTTTISNLGNLVEAKFLEIVKKCYPDEFLEDKNKPDF